MKQNYLVSTTTSKMNSNDYSDVTILNSDNFDIGILLNCKAQCEKLYPEASMFQYFSVWINNLNSNFTLGTAIFT